MEFLRATDSPVDRAMVDLIDGGAPLAVTEVVFMEVMAGGRTPGEEDELRSRLIGFPLLRLRGLTDFEAAAGIYRRCRAAGERVRQLTDCLVAVPAIRAGAALLHADADFDVIARHSDLRIHPVATRLRGPG